MATCRRLGHYSVKGVVRSSFVFSQCLQNGSTSMSGLSRFDRLATRVPATG